MDLTLTKLLTYIGKLEDSVTNDSPQTRFRAFLQEEVITASQLRDYVQECLRNSGDQYYRALQDLLAWAGHFLGFEVTFGRYHGVRGQVGFDGLWTSPSGYHVVVEVKTTGTYAINTAPLVGYVDSLISAKTIPDWDTALGLYVIGRLDPGIVQLEHSITAERRKLRIIMADSLLSLAETSDALALLLPSGARVDPVVTLISRLLAQHDTNPDEIVDPQFTRAQSTRAHQPTPSPEAQGDESAPEFWLTPVASDDEAAAEDVIRTLVGQHAIYAYGERTPGRQRLKPGDRLCFYASGTGIVGHATVASVPAKQQHPNVRHPERYPWVFHLKNAALYLDNPVILHPDLRIKLDAFSGKDPRKGWSWLVQATRRISMHDYDLLTRHI